MRKVFFIIIIISFVPGIVVAYGLDTHAALTQEAALVFNKYFDKKITSEQIQWLIQGSVDEDQFPRTLNHFFDPINDQGLIFAGRQWPTSKEWAQSAGMQISAIFNPPAAIAALFKVVDDSVLSRSDFTWGKAISEYKKGNFKEAFLALGHIIHLIEDLSVPAHARNDIHFPYDQVGVIYGGADPYESYCEQFDLSSINLVDKVGDPIILPSLNDYFDGIAKYTNANFYSKDSIGFDWYALPAPIEKNNLRKGEFDYQQWSDGEGLYPVVQVLKSNGVIKKTKLDFSVSNNLILSEYWNRLSKKAVEYSAGIINLFFEETEPVEAIVSQEKVEKEVLGVAIEVDDDEDGDEVAVEAEVEYSFNGGDDKLTGSSGIILEEEKTGPVLIAELFINMVGTDNSEYIKLYNPNDFEINISQWSIQYLSEGADSLSKIYKKNFIENSFISPQGTYLIGLKNYADEKDMGWSRSLGNTGGSIILVNNQEVVTSQDDDNIIDVLAYGEISGIFIGETKAAILPPEGRLLKRLALVDGECISNKQGDLGYGCDTGNNYHDFESNGEEIIEDSVNTPSSTPSIKDEDGISRISYLKDFRFYEAEEKYFVDLSWEQYPFITKNIPHPALGDIDGWHVVVFYMNQEPEEVLHLGEAFESHMWGMAKNIPGTVRVKYKNCQNNLVASTGLILPDTKDQCSGIFDQVKANSIKWDSLLGNNLILEVDKRDLTNPEKGKDYITIAYYAYHPNANFNSNQVLIGIDPNKYYLK